LPFFLFLWHEKVVEHLAEHAVTQDEFESVVCNPGLVDVSRTTGRPVAVGFTTEGRLLVCVYEHADDDTVIPITAFEPDQE
jgi:hypothetical protein